MRTEWFCNLVVAVCVVALFSACGAPEMRPPKTDTAHAVGPVPPPEWALEKGQLVPMNTRRSRIVIRVYRGGRLAHLGHNHVLEVRGMQGDLKQLDNGGGLAKLTIPVDEIVVDDAAARTRAGADFASQPKASAIAGTRSNLLGEKVLDAVNWPVVKLIARVADLQAADAVAQLYLNVRGVSRLYQVPVKGVSEDGGFGVSGILKLRQSDFGITPFAVLGGALRVQDEIEAEFLIVGRNSDAAL